MRIESDIVDAEYDKVSCSCEDYSFLVEHISNRMNIIRAALTMDTIVESDLLLMGKEE